jgi:ribonuclease HII
MLAFDRSFIDRPSLFSGLMGGEFQAPSAVIGVDEVGRGCLAGPVVAAAVLLPEIKPGTALSRKLRRLDDSKKLSPADREELSAIIHACSVCAVSVDEIDTMNILNASLLAMKRAHARLDGVPPAVVLVDGNRPIPDLPDLQFTVVKGDSQSASIAAASVIAKVYRDALMCRLSADYPEYAWTDNKGYGSPAHLRAIARAGLTPWHRRSFSIGSASAAGPSSGSQAD